MKNEYDLLKVFAIMLVVVGHVTNHYPQLGAITSAIYLFHMPLFIAISGAVYQMGVERGKYVDFVPFVVNKTKRILVPLIFTAVCVLMPTLVLLGKSELGPAETALDILHGGGYSKHLWYLQACCLWFLVAWSVTRVKMFPEIALVLSIALTCAIEAVGFRFRFFMLDPAIADLPFFLLGMVLIKYKNADLKRMMLIVGGILVLWVALRFITYHPTVVYFNRILIRPAIIISLIWGSRFVLEKLKDAPILVFVLKNSFAIYLFHMTFIYLARYFFETQISVCVMLPIEFAMAVVGSIVCATAMRKFKIAFCIGE